jgi:hypothetical protein
LFAVWLALFSFRGPEGGREREREKSVIISSLSARVFVLVVSGWGRNVREGFAAGVLCWSLKNFGVSVWSLEQECKSGVLLVIRVCTKLRRTRAVRVRWIFAAKGIGILISMPPARLTVCGLDSWCGSFSGFYAF